MIVITRGNLKDSNKSQAESQMETIDRIQDLYDRKIDFLLNQSDKTLATLKKRICGDKDYIILRCRKVTWDELLEGL